MPDLCLLNENRKTNESLISEISAKISEGSEITSSDLKALDGLLNDAANTNNHSNNNNNVVPYLDRPFLRQLNASHPQLVRHVGMVQDMLDPEYYLSKVGGKSTHFRDLPIAANDFPREELASSLAERTPLMVVPIPFATDWFANKLRSSSSFQVSPTAAAEEAEHSMTMIPESPVLETGATRKRDRDSPGTEDGVASKQRTQVREENLNTMECDAKATNNNQNTSNNSSNDNNHDERTADWWPAGCMDSAADQSPVLAKFYYDQCGVGKRKLRLNDIVETIGVLSLDPTEAEFIGSGNHNENYDNDGFGTAPTPPPSLCPRLHVLSFRILDLDELVSSHRCNCSFEKETMSMDLETTVLKDSLLAETVWMALQSTAERTFHKETHSNNDGEELPREMKRAPQHALGCASLQISSTNSKALYDQLQPILQSLCPVVATINLTQHKISSPSKGIQFCEAITIDPPTKANGKMMASPLQLPKGSTLLILLDEKCRPSNINVLTELVSQHRIPYVFEGGMRVPFEADYRTIVITSHKTQRLPCTLYLNGENTGISISGNILPTLRSLYNRKVLSNIGLPTEVLEKAQDDFLQRRSQARKSDKELPKEEDFHRWLTLTRLQARTRGSTTASSHDWERALVFDDAVKQSG